MSKSSLIAPSFSFRFKVARFLWNIFQFFFIRWSPVPLFSYRNLLIRIWGAKLAPSARIYPSAVIWWPGNLALGSDSTLGPYVRVYNQGDINISDRVIISQFSYLCASTHDYNEPHHSLILAPIKIESNVWVCAEAFVGPGAQLSEGTVVGARAVISKKTAPWSIYAGNPAKKIKDRRNFS